MDDDQQLAHSSILSSIRNLHRYNSELRNAARTRADNRNTTAPQRERERATLRFTEVYERELNRAIDAVEKQFAESGVK